VITVSNTVSIPSKSQGLRCRVCLSPMEEKDPNPPPVPVASAPARDTTHLAIVKPGTPIVCLDELGEQSAACPGGLHMDKAGLDLEICRNARICRQGQMPDSARERDSAKSAVNYSRVRIKMLANSEAIAVTFQNVWIAQCLPYRKEDRADASLPRLATRQLNAPTLRTVRVQAQADERCPVQLLHSVLALDRALHPDGYAGKGRGDTAFGEYRRVSRR